MTTFFYVAGMTFTLSAVALVTLALIALVAPPFRVRLPHLLSSATWIFVAAASVVAFAYVWELVVALTSSNPYERSTFWHTVSGSYAWAYWLTLAFVFLPQLFWFTRFRRQPLSIFLIAAASLLPTAAERLVVAISS